MLRTSVISAVVVASLSFFGCNGSSDSAATQEKEKANASESSNNQEQASNSGDASTVNPDAVQSSGSMSAEDQNMKFGIQIPSMSLENGDQFETYTPGGFALQAEDWNLESAEMVDANGAASSGETLRARCAPGTMIQLQGVQKACYGITITRTDTGHTMSVAGELAAVQCTFVEVEAGFLEIGVEYEVSAFNICALPEAGSQPVIMYGLNEQEEHKYTIGADMDGGTMMIMLEKKRATVKINND